MKPGDHAPTARRLFHGSVAALTSLFSFFSVWTVGSNLATFTAAPFGVLYAVFIAALGGAIAGGLVAQRLAEALSAPELSAPALDLKFSGSAPRRDLILVAACGIVFAAGLVGVVKFTAFWPLWLSGLALAAVAGTFSPLDDRKAASATTDVGGNDAGLLALFAMLTLALYFFINNPDGDDAFYLNLPIGMKTSAQGLMAFDTMLGGEWPLLMSTYRAESLPTLIAFLSAISGVDVIYVAHALLPFLWCLVFALTVFVIGRVLFGSAWFVFGLFWLALLLALDGTLQGYGVHGLVRLYHGKGPLICFVVPLLFFIAYAALRTRDNVFIPAAVVLHVAALGFTANAIYVAPLALGLVCGAYFLDPASRRQVRAVALLCTAAYPVGVALYLLFFDPPTSYEVVGAQTVAQDLWSIFPTKYAVAFFAAVLAAAAGAGAVDRRWRLASFYVASLLLFVLNPLVWPVFAELVTGKLNYRLFWAIPAPMLLAAGSVLIWRSSGVVFRTGLAALAVALLVAPTSILRSETGGRFEFSLRKVDPAVFAAAEDASAMTDEGMRILAPPRLALWVAAQEGFRAPVAVRTDYLVIRERNAQPDSLAARRELFSWISGASGGLGPDGRKALSRLCVQTVAVDGERPEAIRLREELDGMGAKAAGGAAGFSFFRLGIDPSQCPAADL